MLLPAFYSFLFLHEDKIREVQRRDLTQMAKISSLMLEPRIYFQTLSSWLSERAGGVTTSKRLLSKTQYYVFNDPPGNTFNIGNNGELYLHTFNPDEPFSAASVCFPKLQERVYSNTVNTVRQIKSLLTRRAIDVSVIIIPSKFVVYGDNLGKGTPTNVRKACLTYSQNPLFKQINMLTDVKVVYPYDEYVVKKDDPFFYPIGSFHWAGESVHTAIQSYVERFQSQQLTILDGSYTVHNIEHDMEHLVGFKRTFPGRVYDYSSHKVTYRSTLPGNLGQRLAKKVARAFTTSENPVFDKRALLLTNSFGNQGHKHLSAVYRELVWININHIKQNELEYILKEYTDTYRPQELVILTHDRAIVNRASRILEALQ